MKLSEVKIGMRVSVYSPHGRAVGTVEDITAGMVKLERSPIYFHPRQLRKLVKREPEILWVRVCTKDCNHNWAAAELCHDGRGACGLAMQILALLPHREKGEGE